MDDKRLNLLCVADDPADIHSIQELINALRWTATFASNGLDGYAFAKTSRFDVIVTDQDMTDLPGLSLFKCIRTGNGPNAGTPFLLTGRSFTPEIVQSANEMQIEAVVEKPLLRSHLKDLLANLAKGEHAANDGSAPSGQCRILHSVPAFQKFFG